MSVIPCNDKNKNKCIQSPIIDLTYRKPSIIENKILEE
jgi:hypothetical protein